MNITSTILRALDGRGPSPDSAFFSSRIARSRAALALALPFLLLAAPVRADLLVLNSAGSASQVWRFHGATGAPLPGFSWTNEGMSSLTVTPFNEVYVNANILGSYALYRFDAASGEFQGSVVDGWQAGLGSAARGPDGNLYVTWWDETAQASRIVRLDGPAPTTFVAAGAGGMSRMTGFVFGPDGHLYVNDANAGILRFHGTTGAPLGVVVPPGRGGLADVSRIAFGPDGRLYAACASLHAVLRFDAASGAFVDTFVAPGSGGLANPRGLAFGPDGNLCVSSRDTHQVLRYSGSTGAYLGIAAQVDAPAGDPRTKLADIAFVAGAPGTDMVWFDDALPAGAVAGTSHGGPWAWVTSNPTPQGTRAHRANAAFTAETVGGLQEHYFNFASQTMGVGAGDTLFVYVYLDSSPTADQEIMVSWCDGAWDHRAYWGANRINAGQNGTASRRYMGAIPPRGGWQRLEVPAALVGLEGRVVQGISFSALDVAATFDRVGRRTPGVAASGDVTPPTVQLTAPAANATVSGTVTIAFAATDNVSTPSVELRLDSTLLASVSGSGAQSRTWDTRTVADGAHTLTATAFDAAGNRAAASVAVTVSNLTPTGPTGPQVVWFDDALPTDAVTSASPNDAWTWVTGGPAPFSGSRAHQSAVAPGLHEHAFDWCYRGSLDIKPTDTIFAYVCLDPANPPQALMLSFRDADNWEHRAYWGADLIGYGQNGTASRRRIGNLPAAGVWTRLEIPASAIGLGDTALYGMSFSLFDGRATWDLVGKTIAGGDTRAPTVEFTAPLANATVSGTLTISAAASDDVGIASVEFRLDAARLVLDVATPYATSWDTTTAAAGAHTLTAIVTDSSGRTATTSIAVTVNNGATPPATGADTVWFDDSIPAGAQSGGNGGDGWNWITSGPTPQSGTRAHQSNVAAGLHEHFIDWATSQPLAVAASDTLFAWVFLDPANPPQEIMLSWRDGSNWEHRAYWGADLISYGTAGTGSRRSMGALPAAGGWTRLTVPASAVDLGASPLIGMSFGLFGGRATWDATGRIGGGAGTGGDTAPPTVAVASPAGNAVVAGGAVILSANASDNVGVASVRFRLDGADIGDLDTSAPFSVSWNSATVANGTHALTAVARDAAGNQATSPAVLISVNNATTTTSAVIWMDGAVPADAVTGSSGGDGWNWVTTNPVPFAGARAHQSAIASGTHDHFFVGTSSPLALYAGDTIFVYVQLDPANLPSEIMLSFNDGTWEHRAYWGANLIPYGQNGTASQRFMGPLPAAGQWVKLEIPARLVGLEGRSVNGVSFTLVGGRATWDIIGKFSP